MAAGDALPMPRKNIAFRLYFEIRDNLGNPVTSAAGLDSEVSKDGGAFADCTNEAVEVGQGVYYLELTSTEMNADGVVVVTKTSTTNAIQPTTIIYPAEDADIRANSVMQNGTALTARDIGASVLLSSGTGTGQVSLSAGLVNVNGLNTNALNLIAGAVPNLAGIADAVWDETITAHINTDSAAEALSIARDSTSDLAAVKAKTDNLPASPAATGDQMDLIDAPNATAISAIQNGIDSQAAAAVLGATSSEQVSGTIGGSIHSTKVAVETLATDVATAVRLDLATELARIDVDISSRAAPGDEMDLIDAPNATAVTAIQDGLALASGVTVSDKTGFKLASDGLDSVSATEPTGVASTFPQRLLQVWCRFFRPAVHDTAAETLKTYASDGTTLRTTQSLTVVGDTETQGNAT